MVNKLFIVLTIALMFAPAFALADSGAIWTTLNDCGDSSQDVNHYSVNDTVYINGDGFEEGNYSWDITGLPGGASCTPEVVVASGNINVDESEAFCFPAHVVMPDECGEYKATFDGKHDNYRVNETPVIPEFGLIAGLVTIAGAIAAFFLIRK